ncbi:MAG: VWA domain-containing protein [Porticoccus sp.]|nr:VWA domain-containing protein [Porticoccus sp.]
MILVLVQVKQRDLLGQWYQVIAAHLLPLMIVQRENKPWRGPLGIMAVISILLCVSLAGPSWEKRPSPFSEDNAVLVIAMDLSESMNQNDIQPSRLQRAKQKVMDLLEQRGDSYTGLIAFAGTAHTVIPLSNDRRVISHFLDAISTRMMPRPGKAPEAILPVVDHLLKDLNVPATLLVIGDGANGKSVNAFKEYFKTSPHQLLVWGIGMTQEQLDQQMLDGYSASTIALQEPMLRQLASSVNGHYQSLTIDKSDVDLIYRRVDNYFLLAEDDTRPWVDAGYWLIFPMMLLFVLWFRKGWSIRW